MCTVHASGVCLREKDRGERAERGGGGREGGGECARQIESKRVREREIVR